MKTKTISNAKPYQKPNVRSSARNPQRTAVGRGIMPKPGSFALHDPLQDGRRRKPSPFRLVIPARIVAKKPGNHVEVVLQNIFGGDGSKKTVRRATLIKWNHPQV